jgi:hypothetical protein
VPALQVLVLQASALQVWSPEFKPSPTKTNKTKKRQIGLKKRYNSLLSVRNSPHSQIYIQIEMKRCKMIFLAKWNPKAYRSHVYLIF